MEFSLDIFGTIKIQRMSRFGIDTALNKFNLQLETYQNYSLLFAGFTFENFGLLTTFCIFHFGSIMHWPLAVPKLQGSNLVFLWPRREKT